MESAVVPKDPLFGKSRDAEVGWGLIGANCIGKRRVGSCIESRIGDVGRRDGLDRKMRGKGREKCDHSSHDRRLLSSLSPGASERTARSPHAQRTSSRYAATATSFARLRPRAFIRERPRLDTSSGAILTRLLGNRFRDAVSLTVTQPVLPLEATRDGDVQRRPRTLEVFYGSHRHETPAAVDGKGES